jgi:hypothetical protein
MAKYRVTDVHHGRRTAVFDGYGRCVELVPAGMSDAQLAALITAQDAAGAYLPDRLLAQRTFDSGTQEWANIQWPTED